MNVRFKAFVSFGTGLTLVMFAMAFPKLFLFFTEIHLSGLSWAMTILTGAFLMVRSFWVFLPTKAEVSTYKPEVKMAKPE